MSIKTLQALREQAWIPTPHGEQFSLYFDDTLYLKLVAKYILDQAEYIDLDKLRKLYEND